MQPGYPYFQGSPSEMDAADLYQLWHVSSTTIQRIRRYIISKWLAWLRNRPRDLITNGLYNLGGSQGINSRN